MSRRSLCLVTGVWLVVALVVARAPVGVRAPCVVAFALFAPGSALMGFVPRSDRLSRIVTVVATSLSLDVVASESLALAHKFSGLNSVMVLAGLTTVLALSKDWFTARASSRALRTADSSYESEHR